MENNGVIIRTQAVSWDETENQTILKMLPQEADAERVVFLDIETTGFSRMYDSIYLVGILYWVKQVPFIDQYFAQSEADEPELLEAVCERLQMYQTVVTFNGDSFDLPFIEERIRRMRLNAELPSFRRIDLYRDARTLQPLTGWKSCRLKEIESKLGIARQDEMTGGELIDVYYRYSTSLDGECEKLLLLHNCEDVQNLPLLLPIHCLLERLHVLDFENVRTELSENELVFSLTSCDLNRISLDARYLPEKNALSSFAIRLCMSADLKEIRMHVPLQNGTMRFYFPDYKDYYAAPDGALIHKSLGTPPDRRKALPQECFVQKNDGFLFCTEKKLKMPQLHLFRTEYEEKQRFLAVSEFLQKLQNGSEEERRTLIRLFLPSFLRK